MFKKVSSLLLCGLISFSLFGMQDPSEDGNDLNFINMAHVAGPPPALVAPALTKFQKLKAHVKILAPLAVGAGVFGFACGNIWDPRVEISSMGKLDFSARLAGSFLLLYPLFRLSEYSGNLERQSNIVINPFVLVAISSSAAVLGAVGGLCTGILLRRHFQNKT